MNTAQACESFSFPVLDYVKVKVINNSDFALPEYATPGSAGMDLRANISSPIMLGPMERRVISTGLSLELPAGYEAQVRPRSGLALKHGVTVINSPGTIDSDFRGDIGVILINLGNTPFTINPGERIAQMVIKEYVRAEWEPVSDLSNTERGTGGFGHSGTN